MLFDKAHSLCHKKQRIIVSEENKRKHIAINGNDHNVYQYKIDGDIVPKSTSMARCDYIVEVENAKKPSAYLIELKGTDLNHAIDQIEATLQMFSSKLSAYNVFLRIVYRSNTQAINSTKAAKFKKKYGSRQRIATNEIQDNI